MRFGLKALLAITAVALAAGAHAAPVITWNVGITGTWTDYAPNPGVTVSGDLKTLSWGTPAAPNNQQSSLAITDPAATDVDTYYGGGVPPAAFIAPSIGLTHSNFPIFAPSLASAELTVAIALTAIDPALGAVPVPDIMYNIAFLETPNTEGTCVVPSPTPCNDIFVLVGGLLNTSFTFLEQKYFVNVFPTTGGILAPLSDAACAAVGQPNNCIGFSTPENQQTQLAFGLTISSEQLQIPAPGTLLLAGLALVAAGVTARRREVH